MTNAPELDRLIFRLRQVMLPTKRFLKINADKSPKAESFEWQNDPWGIDDLPSWPRWGVAGRDGLVIIDCDNHETENFIRKTLLATFEVKTVRRKMTHFYFKVEGEQVPNMTLKIDGKGAGEVRANNWFVVAPGTEVDFTDKTGAHVKGKYEIQADRRIATISYRAFMAAIEPLTGTEAERKLTFEVIEKGVEIGERHARVHQLATFLVGVQKMDYATALFTVRQWNQTHCHPPIDDKDIVRSVKNATKYVEKSKAPEVQQEAPHDDSQLIERMSKTDTFDYLVEFLSKTIKNDPRYIHNVLMCAFSAYTTDPINAGSEAPTSEGKSYGYLEVLRIFPDSDVMLMGGMSPKSLVHRKAKLYDNEGNDITVILNKLTAELAELQSVKKQARDEIAIAAKKAERATLMNNGKWVINLENNIMLFLEVPSLETFMMLRPLMSHDAYETSYEFVDPQSLHTRKIILRGWPLVFYCKAGRGKEDIIWPELKSRAILITPAMNSEKYRAGVELVSQRKGLPGPVSDSVIGVQNISEVKRVVELIKAKLTDTSKAIRTKGYRPDANGFWIPFYKEIGAEFPANVGRNMRDAKRFISMICMSAAVNVYGRPTVEVDGVNYVIAIPADYARAKQIFFEETGTEIFTGVPSHVLKLFREVIVPLAAGEVKEPQQKLSDRKILDDPKGWLDVSTRSITEHSGIVAHTLRAHYLTQLEDAGLLSSYPDPNDKRSKVWHIMKLTPDTNLSPNIVLFGKGGIFTLELFKERLNELKQIRPANVNIRGPLSPSPALTEKELYDKYYVPPHFEDLSGRIEQEPPAPPIDENTDKKADRTQKDAKGRIIEVL